MESKYIVSIHNVFMQNHSILTKKYAGRESCCIVAEGNLLYKFTTM